MLFYVDSIIKVPEREEEAEVVLLKASDDNDNESIKIRILSRSLHFSNGRKVVETDYVYYEPDREHIFHNGNNSTFARRQRQLYAIYRRFLQDISQEHHAEELNQRNFGRDTLARSYHVNVGHGNCSVILTMRGSFYTLWMVDCSVLEIGTNSNYSLNLEDCIGQIANDLQVEKENLKFSIFMLTHAHYDHYNGLEYLIDHGYLQQGATIYHNQWYNSPSPTMVRILKKMTTLGCIIKEPLRNTAIGSPIHVIYPKYRIYKKQPKVNPGVQYRIEKNTNNSSIVYHVTVGSKSMILPGDIEISGINYITKNRYCITQFFDAQYYCISHHGSQTGHINIACLGRSTYNNVLHCKRENLSKAIMMGRNGAYSGIYSQSVISDFGKNLVYTEKDNNNNPIRFFRLDWDTSVVTYY